MKTNLSAEDRLTRALVGVGLIIGASVSWGTWFIIAIGILLLISSVAGYCMTNELFKKLKNN